MVYCVPGISVVAMCVFMYFSCTAVSADNSARVVAINMVACTVLVLFVLRVTCKTLQAKTLIILKCNRTEACVQQQ